MNNNEYIPAWLNEAIIYHIYPLGFFNAPKFGHNETIITNRLEKIRNYYNYFIELGINTIQFGPIFESVSHGYDTIDHLKIDHRLGTNELFREIVEELHNQGIRVIVDGVFNHVGRDFHSFKDVQSQHQNSTKIHWHYIDFSGNNSFNDGFRYQNWEGHDELVRLNLANNEVRGYLFNVSRYWLGEIGIDGWRLDVAYQIDVNFWRDFKSVCKEINKESVLIGELIHGDYSTWIGTDRLDSGTDYQTHKSIWSAIKDKNMYELRNVLDIAFNAQGRHKNLVLMNFLGNHDTNRIASVLKKEQLIPAFLILMTLNGYPKIYYGDEIGMLGKKTSHSDNEVRKPMIDITKTWPEFGKELFNNIKHFIKLRKDYPALQYGNIVLIDPIQWDPNIIIYRRQTQTQNIIVVVNTQHETRSISIVLPDSNQNQFMDILNGFEQIPIENGKIGPIICYPFWGRIIQIK